MVSNPAFRHSRRLVMVAVALFLALPSMLHAQLSRQAYIAAYDELEELIWRVWEDNPVYVTGPEASANVGDAASVLMQGQLTLYECTGDRAYLDDFLKWANFLLANINDTAGEPVYRRKDDGSRYRGWGAFRLGYNLLALNEAEAEFADNQTKVFTRFNNQGVLRDSARSYEPGQEYLLELAKAEGPQFVVVVRHNNQILVTLQVPGSSAYGSARFTAPIIGSTSGLEITIQRTGGTGLTSISANLQQYAEFCVHDGKAAAAFARFAALIVNSHSGLQQALYADGKTFLEWADTLRWLAWELTQKWILDYRYLYEDPGGLPMRPTGDYSTWVNHPEWGFLRGPDDASNGIDEFVNRSLPLNRFASWALGALWTIDAFPESEHADIRSRLYDCVRPIHESILIALRIAPQDLSRYWHYSHKYSSDDSDKHTSQDLQPEDRGHAQAVLSFLARAAECNLDPNGACLHASRTLLHWAWDTENDPLTNPRFFLHIGDRKVFPSDPANPYAPFFSGWSELLWIDNNRLLPGSSAPGENWDAIDALLRYVSPTRNLLDKAKYGPSVQPLYLIYHTINALAGQARFARGWVANPEFEVYNPLTASLFRNWRVRQLGEAVRDSTHVKNGYHSAQLRKMILTEFPWLEQELYNVPVGVPEISVSVWSYATSFLAMGRRIRILEQGTFVEVAASTVAFGSGVWQRQQVTFTPAQGKRYLVRLEGVQGGTLANEPVWFDSFESSL